MSGCNIHWHYDVNVLSERFTSFHRRRVLLAIDTIWNTVVSAAKPCYFPSLWTTRKPLSDSSPVARARAGKRDAGAGGLHSPFLFPIIPCFICLPQLTPAPFRHRETTGDESEPLSSVNEIRGAKLQPIKVGLYFYQGAVNYRGDMSRC